MSSWRSRATTASTRFGCSMGSPETIGRHEARASETVRRGRSSGAHRFLGGVGSHLWQATQAAASRAPAGAGTARTYQARPGGPRAAAGGERATIDRMLSGARASAGGRRARAKTTPAVRRRVPVRTFADWHDPPPGFVEADLVVHCGESMAGSFASTLVLTDIASGWTECIALLVREGELDRRRARATPRDAAVSAARHRHGQRQRVHQRAVDHVLHRPRHRVHPIAPVSQERSGLGRAEERLGRAPARRLRPAGRRRGGRGALAALLGLALVRELLPALVQARRARNGSALMSASATTRPKRPVRGCWPRRPSPNR